MAKYVMGMVERLDGWMMMGLRCCRRRNQIVSNTRFREDLEDDMGARKGVRCEWTLGALGLI